MGGDLLRFAVAHLRGSWRRTAAAAAAIFVAVSSFVVLTGTVTAQRLQVTQEVASNYRSSYDILVRPKGSADQIEKTDNVVRSNFLSGTYGGITMDQVKEIASVPGVEVTAPVAVLGQTMRNVLIPVDVGTVLAGRAHAMVRFALTGTARNGTAHTTNQNGYLYLTRSALTAVDRKERVSSSPPQIEKRDSRTITACLASDAGGPAATPAAAFTQQCWSTQSSKGSTPRVEILLSLPLTVAAVDPAAEAQLTGLNQAITAGRALSASDSFGVDSTGPAPIYTATAVMASHLPFDYRAAISVQQLSDATTDRVLSSKDTATRRRLVLDATPERTVATLSRDAAVTYRDDIVPSVGAGTAGSADQSLIVLAITQPGDVSYTSTDPLSPRVVAFDPKKWRNGDGIDFVPAPSSVTDTGYRHITGQPRTDRSTFVSFKVVGTYDPDRLPRPSRLNEVPLETYRSSTLVGADAASRVVLGDKPLRSDLNPGGYVQSPPALLVPLKALPLFWKNFNGLEKKAPVSSVRVRVAGITGLDSVNREKIRQIAGTVASRTGLQVDITIGASLQNRRVNLPATASGTPNLALNELWTKKGVAVSISQALDIKSLVLFIIILASSALTVALIATATVATRRRELATLACLGWPGRRIGSLLAAELTLLGLGAGILGAIFSWPMAQALNISVAWWQVALAVPLGALLALLPGLAGTITASRIAPIDAFRPKPERSRVWAWLSFTGPAALGLIMTVRRPGRATLGALSVALAVASAVGLATVVRAFDGAVVGSFLGDAVALQVRGPDIVAAAVLAILGLTAVVTVLLLSLAEDAPSFAALQATGWTDRSLTATLLTQAGAIGLAGALPGAFLALASTSLFIGPPTLTIVALTVLIVLIAVAASVAAALIPALLLRRLPTARILAGE